MAEEVQHIAVLRLSAMGDVAMLYPVLKQMEQQYPKLKITVVSRPLFKPFFYNLGNVQFFPVDLSSKHKGARGLWRLAREICAIKNLKGVADVHDVLRTKIVRVYLKVLGVNTSSIDKGRSEKRKLTRKNDKVLKPLQHTTERYADVFAQLGYPVQLPHTLLERKALESSDRVNEIILHSKDGGLVGFAPFAFHRGKMLPPGKIEELLEALSTKLNCRVLLFGGGIEEIRKLGTLADAYDNVESVAGKLSLEEEIQLISRLNVMISMDSANMHIASLCGVPVVSIWGATHHYAGFLGYGQQEAHIVDVPNSELPCRPCSVFGNKPCWRDDYACMETLNVAHIVDKVAGLCN